MQAAPARHPLSAACAVLLIARDAERARPFREALAAAGHRVLASADAVTAIRGAIHTGVDVVVVEADAAPLDGLTVAAVLNVEASTRRLPVLILADAEDQRLRTRAREVGAAGVLVRPLPATLAGIVSRFGQKSNAPRSEPALRSRPPQTPRAGRL